MRRNRTQQALRRGICQAVIGGLMLATSGLAPALAGQSEFELRDGMLMVKEQIAFEAGKDTVTAESEPALKHVAAFLSAKTYVTLLRIEVHTDSQGDAAKNQTLSDKRSLAVGQWLVGHGVDCKRLIAVGFGSTKPVADNATPTGRAQNRRVVFAPATLRGHAIGGMPVDGGGHVAGNLCN